MVTLDPGIPNGLYRGRDAANAEAVRRMTEADPVLVDVRPAREVVPGMTDKTVLTSGAPLPWTAYQGGQREGIIGGVLYEGLAAGRAEAEAALSSGQVTLDGCHGHGCVGSLAGIYTASMPVFVVEDRQTGRRGFCNFFEGASHKRLNYGCYDDEVRDNLRFVEQAIAPGVGEAVRQAGGVPLKPIMRRALHMGDELHSRNTAATMLFGREIYPSLLDMAREDHDAAARVIAFLTGNDYAFLRLSMAAAKVMADAAHGVDGSSVVTAMTFSCSEFAIRVSGLGDTWFRGPHGRIQARLFDGHTDDEITFMGGESPITETVGLGGFAQAAAFPLQAYQGGSAQLMVERNLAMYQITVAENPSFHIPFFDYRGTPTGIDIFKVAESQVLPLMDVGVPSTKGGQIGAGVLEAPMPCFTAAQAAYAARYAGAAR
jgi:Protein of unknown function (DUF1116)